MALHHALGDRRKAVGRVRRASLLATQQYNDDDDDDENNDDAGKSNPARRRQAQSDGVSRICRGRNTSGVNETVKEISLYQLRATQMLRNARGGGVKFPEKRITKVYGSTLSALQGEGGVKIPGKSIT